MRKTIAIAPMMGYTDRHYRQFMRGITQSTRMYTEMYTTSQIIHGNTDRCLSSDLREHSVILQIGGSDPAELRACVDMAESRGCYAINLNIGCPSPRVQKIEIGACLFKKPYKVAQCIDAMRINSNMNISIKTRLGVDDCDKDKDIINFISTVFRAGCTDIILHARKAWLSGVSTKHNRSIPPLQYDRAQMLASYFPDINWMINGGIQTLDDIDHHLQCFNGVMLGRSACANPFMFASVDSRYYGKKQCITRFQAINKYQDYFILEAGKAPSRVGLIRPLLNLYYGVANAKQWKKLCVKLAHIPIRQLEYEYTRLKDYAEMYG